MEPQLNTM